MGYLGISLQILHGNFLLFCQRMLLRHDKNVLKLPYGLITEMIVFQQGQKVILIAGLVTDDAQVVVVIYHIADGTQIIGLIDCDFHPFVHRKFRDKGGESIDNIAPSWYGKLIPRFITV